MGFPAADTLRDYLVNMFEYAALLAIGVGNIISMQPFVEQVNPAANFGGEPNHRGDMILFHAQHQIGLVQDGRRQLMRPVHRAVNAVFGKQLQGSRIHRAADERAEPRAAEFDAALRHALSKQVFGHWAAADVAHADDQYPFVHGADLLPGSRPARVDQGRWK